MSLSSSNIIITSNMDLDDDVNPNSSEVESLFINTLIMNDINYIYFLNNFDNNLNCENSGENSIDYSIKNEKLSKKEENNEVSLILISCSDSKDNDYNSENSKSTKVLDKTIPLKTKKYLKLFIQMISLFLILAFMIIIQIK